MRSVFGLLLIVLGPMLVGGCALPDRSISRVDDLGFRQRGSRRPDPSIVGAKNEDNFENPEGIKKTTEAKNQDRVETAVRSKNQGADTAVRLKNQGADTPRSPGTLGKSNGSVEPPTGNIAFKSPRLDRGPEEISSESFQGASSDLNRGHSGDGTTDSDSVVQSSATTSSKIVRSPVVQASAGQTSFVGGNDETQGGSFDSNRSNVNNANGPLQADEAIPVQLQGLEFDDTAPASNQRPDTLQSARDESTTQIPNGGPSARTEAAGQDESRIQPWSERPAITRTANATFGESNRGANSRDRAKAPLINRDAAQLPPLPWQSDLEQLIARVEQDLAGAKPDSRADKQNEYLRKQAHLRLLYLMAQRQEEALTAIPGIDAPQQEYWQQMVWAMSNSLDTAQFPELSDRAAQSVPPLSAALRQMREEASLAIKNMTFCRKISYFGNYERFPRNEFTPGYEVLLYTEIENFVSTPTVDGEYRTSLKSQIEITDSQGKVVWTKGFPPTEDFCRNPRRDYFHNYQFHIPEDLPTGTYTLKLTIVDELSHKRVSNSLKFVLK